MEGRGHLLAYVCAVMNAVIIGLSFLFTKIALEYASPLDTLTYRFAVSLMAIAIPIAFGRLKLKAKGKPWKPIMLLATLYPLLFFVSQTFGLERTTSAEGGIIYALTPVLTTLLASFFLKESTTRRQKFFIVLSIAGVVWIFLMKGTGIEPINPAGTALLFLSCSSFAGYSVWARKLLKTYTPVEISSMMLGIGGVAFAAVSLVGHAHAGTMQAFFLPLTHVPFLLSILYLGVMSTLVTALTANYALSKLDASKASVFSNLSTVVSIAAGALLLNERIGAYHVTGSLFIIVGVIGANRIKATARQRANLNRELVSK